MSVDLSQVAEHIVLEDVGVCIMARVVGNDAAAITQATISSISHKVTDLNTNTALTSGALTVASVVYDTLQTDARWTADTTGYNFAYVIPDTVIASGGTSVVVDVTFNPTTGQDFAVVWPLKVLKRYN